MVLDFLAYASGSICGFLSARLMAARFLAVALLLSGSASAQYSPGSYLGPRPWLAPVLVPMKPVPPVVTYIPVPGRTTPEPVFNPAPYSYGPYEFGAVGSFVRDPNPIYLDAKPVVVPHVPKFNRYTGEWK